MDFSGRFVDTSLSIQEGKEVEFGEKQVASVLMTSGVDSNRALFKQVAISITLIVCH